MRASAIFGTWLEYEPDPAGQLLGSDFERFHCVCGIRGLARENGTRLDVLAVVATKPGTGQFREFIRECRRRCTAIGIWHERNPLLAAALERYGFKPALFEEGGEKVIGWEWKRKTEIRV